jgi:hypothetical protein
MARRGKEVAYQQKIQEHNNARRAKVVLLKK